MIEVMRATNPDEWDELVYDNGGHPLQLWGWGEVKARHNWKVVRIGVYEDEKLLGLAQILIRKIPMPLAPICYVPRGPVLADKAHEKVVLSTIGEYCQNVVGAMVVSVEPNLEEMEFPDGWTKAENTILIPDTLVLDLKKSEAKLEADMAKKTRQYVRKSARENINVVHVKNHTQLAACLEIYKATAARAGFGLHDDRYYFDVFDQLGDANQLLAAIHDGEVVAFLWNAVSADTAFELYGGMNDKGQELRANYMLKWAAIRECKGWGVKKYDMNGLLNDGVSKFKQGFASHNNTLVGTWELVLNQRKYALWVKHLPRIKAIVRKLKR